MTAKEMTSFKRTMRRGHQNERAAEQFVGSPGAAACHGHHGVELELRFAAGQGDCVVFADHADADHHSGLASGRVDVARRDRPTALVPSKYSLSFRRSAWPGRSRRVERSVCGWPLGSDRL